LNLYKAADNQPTKIADAEQLLRLILGIVEALLVDDGIDGQSGLTADYIKKYV